MLYILGPSPILPTTSFHFGQVRTGIISNTIVIFSRNVRVRTARLVNRVFQFSAKKNFACVYTHVRFLCGIIATLLKHLHADFKVIITGNLPLFRKIPVIFGGASMSALVTARFVWIPRAVDEFLACVVSRTILPARIAVAFEILNILRNGEISGCNRSGSRFAVFRVKVSTQNAFEGGQTVLSEKTVRSQIVCLLKFLNCGKRVVAILAIRPLRIVTQIGQCTLKQLNLGMSRAGILSKIPIPLMNVVKFYLAVVTRASNFNCHNRLSSLKFQCALFLRAICLRRAVPSPSQPHSSHPSPLSFLEKEHIRSQNVRSYDRMFPFDMKHITVLLFCQANFRPFKYIRHFRQFCRTSFVQNSKHMFAYEKERNAQGNQQYSTGVFFAGRGLLTATS